ncbi:triose-phosphate isomerase [Mycoplasmopsis glycophila]|uniref:Triosephosphate isomerase n=1 Tax=Mycoplasmopsis glycophila TaxID=171285 RepID=A0A449AV54_9BACT|nr:triose-phosphate isomerase [Mycoplasmopsis glycophila]VEU70373.1 Triosephosphate isomerase [Mycoplasmopsis glycophila]
MKKMVIIGNWKMNKTFSETEEFLTKFHNEYNLNKSKLIENVDFAIAAPFTNLAAFKSNQVANLKLAAQNMSNKTQGAFTGEISPAMLLDLNVKYVILGHSERREYYGETNEFVYEKAKLALENNLIPVICVGETLAQYEAGQTKQVVKEQIEKSVNDLDLSKIIVAYEPIWAIGTGKVATPEIAQEVCEYIHEITSKELVVQYGGSVSPKNIEELSKQKDIDGFLVGGASLEAESFVKLLTLGK